MQNHHTPQENGTDVPSHSPEERLAEPQDGQQQLDLNIRAVVSGAVGLSYTVINDISDGLTAPSYTVVFPVFDANSRSRRIKVLFDSADGAALLKLLF